MTTLDGRPNTALLVIDVQNDVVSGAWDRDGVIGRINTLVDKARTEHVPVIWVQHSDDNMPMDTDGWQYVPELTRERVRAARPQALRRLVRGHRPRGDPRRATGRAGRRHRRADRRVHPVDPPRRARPRLRRDPRRGRPHDRGPPPVGRAGLTRAGHRPHQRLLVVVRGSGTHGRRDAHGRGRLRRPLTGRRDL